MSENSSLAVATRSGGHRFSDGRDRGGRLPARLARRAAGLLIAGPMCVALLLGPAAAAAGVHAARAPRCATSGLVMWINAEGAGTAGSFYFHIEFANLSGRTCSLSGYPGVSAVGLRGNRIGSPAIREVTGTPGLVTLRPEEQTSAIVRVVDVGALPASCRPAAAAGFRVYPPGETASKVVPFPFHTCSHGGPGALLVRAVKTE